VTAAPRTALLLFDHLDSPERSAETPSGCSLVVEAEVSDDVRLTTARDELQASAGA